jgi:hypothetical protein
MSVVCLMKYSQIQKEMKVETTMFHLLVYAYGKKILMWKTQIFKAFY